MGENKPGKIGKNCGKIVLKKLAKNDEKEKKKKKKLRKNDEKSERKCRRIEGEKNGLSRKTGKQTKIGEKTGKE